MGSLADIKKGMASAMGKVAANDVSSSTPAGNMMPNASTQASSRPQTDSQSDMPVSLFASLGSVFVNMASNYGILDLDVIAANDKLILNGLRPEERFVSFDAADYLAQNFGYIVGMLIMDVNGFRNFVFQGIDTELNIDKLSPDKRSAMRAKMNAKPSFGTAHGMEIGITNFSNYVCVEFKKSADKTFDIIAKSRMNNDINVAAAKLSEDDRRFMGLIFSEYMYFIRGFCYNSVFSGEFMRRVTAFKSVYGIN